MDMKKIIETTNGKLLEATEVCVGVNDAFEAFVTAMQTTLELLTALPQQLRQWDMEEFVELPAGLKEKGLGDDAVVKLTELYHLNRREDKAAAMAALGNGMQSLSTLLGGNSLSSLVSSLIPQASAAQPNEDAAPELGLEEYLSELRHRAEAGDEVSQELLRRYSESVAEAEKGVKSEDDGQR
jgi:aconitase B